MPRLQFPDRLLAAECRQRAVRYARPVTVGLAPAASRAKYYARPGSVRGRPPDLIVSSDGLIRSACGTASTAVRFCLPPIQIFPIGEGPPNIGGPMDSFASTLMLTFACKPFSRLITRTAK